MDAMNYSKQQLEDMVKEVPHWWHSIDLGNGVITPGAKSKETLAAELGSLQLPDLRGKAVLDIGACDGFYSFVAERRHAHRVLALDYYYWRDYAGGITGGAESSESPSRSFPHDLPGKRGFDLCRRVLDSSVESLVEDYMRVEAREIGTFDVVLFLGVLYHMKNPFEALRQLATLTGELAVIETEAMVVPGQEKRAICEFFETDELNHDASNWWSFNAKALESLARAAGFRRLEFVQGPVAQHDKQRKSVSAMIGIAKALGVALQPPLAEAVRYRAIAHAWK